VVTNRTKDGRTYDEDQTMAPVRDRTREITHLVSTGRDVTERRRTTAALRRLNHQLECEATRIAGLLHDQAGQFLASAHMGLADLARDAPPGMRERLQAVRNDMDQIGEQLRRVAHELHPGILDDLGLEQAVAFVAGTFTHRTRIPITVDATLARPCPAHMRVVLYRFVQEALANMAKHSRASAGTIMLRREGACVRCSVIDNGVGFDAQAVLTRQVSRGLGLTLITDRLEAVGGTLQIITSPGQGAELRTMIPEEG
jgi:signal transduction histidine kinase